MTVFIKEYCSLCGFPVHVIVHGLGCVEDHRLSNWRSEEVALSWLGQ